MTMRWFWIQRLSAMMLAPMIVVHLVTIFYAVRGGLSAAEILERIDGSLVWGVFYVLFVLAASIHVPIGLYNVLSEWFAWRARPLLFLVTAFGLILAGIGLRGVWAIL